MLAPRPRARGTFPRARRAPRVTTGGALCPPRRRARRRGTRASREDRPDARPPRTCTPRRRARGDPRARAGRVPRHPRRRLRSRRRRRGGRWRHARSPRGGGARGRAPSDLAAGVFASRAHRQDLLHREQGDVQGRAQLLILVVVGLGVGIAMHRSAPDGILRGAQRGGLDSEEPRHDAVARRRHLPRRARDARRGMLDAPVVAEFDTQKQIRHRDPPTLRTRRVSTSEKCKLPTHPTQLQDTSPMVRFDHVRLPALISMPTPAVSRLP